MKGYTSKQKIEDYLLVTIDSSFDDQVDRWIEAAEEIIDQETGKDFMPQEDEAEPSERVFDGELARNLYVGPFTGDAEVAWDGSEDPIAETAFQALPANAEVKHTIRLKALRFPRGYGNVRVTATWGLPQVPADIELAATVLASAMLTASGAEAFQGGEVQSMTVGRYTVQYRSAGDAGAKVGSGLLSVEGILRRNKRFSF